MDSVDEHHLKEKGTTGAQGLKKLLTSLTMVKSGVLSCFILKISHNEIVDITGFSANDVKSFIQNGKRNLKLKLESQMNEPELWRHK